MNIINKYMDFKKNNLKKYVEIMYNYKIDVFEDFVINTYLNTYTNTYYFHHLDTLSAENVSEYNMKTIVKEFDGKKLEMLYELDPSIDKNHAEKVVKFFYYLVLVAIKVDDLDEINETTVEAILDEVKFTSNTRVGIIKKLTKQVERTRKHEADFFSSIYQENFYLSYNQYRDKTGKYFVELKQNIKTLNDRYSELSISKNYNNEELATKKFSLTLSLLSVDILKRMIADEEIDTYFVKLPDNLLDSKEIYNVLDLIYNQYISSKVSFLVNYSEYLNHKRILNNLDPKYSFAAFIDMSHINNIENKMEAIENIKLFDYGILDKVKPEHYESVIEYELTAKEIFTNEFDRG